MMTLPAPTGGWNAISALADMPLTDAIVMDNIIPQADSEMYNTVGRAKDVWIESGLC